MMLLRVNYLELLTWFITLASVSLMVVDLRALGLVSTSLLSMILLGIWVLFCMAKVSAILSAWIIGLNRK